MKAAFYVDPLPPGSRHGEEDIEVIIPNFQNITQLTSSQAFPAILEASRKLNLIVGNYGYPMMVLESDNFKFPDIPFQPLGELWPAPDDLSAYGWTIPCARAFGRFLADQPNADLLTRACNNINQWLEGYLDKRYTPRECKDSFQTFVGSLSEEERQILGGLSDDMSG